MNTVISEIDATVRALALEGRPVEDMQLWPKSFDCSIFEAKAEIERICCE